MARSALPPGLSAPPLVYAGERERLLAERDEILGKLRRNGGHSSFRWALQRSLVRVTAQLVAISQAPAPVPGSNRKGLQ